MKVRATFYSDENHASGVDVLALVVWLGCLLVGILGLALPYAMPRPKPVALLKVEMLKIEFSQQPKPSRPSPPKQATTQPPDKVIEPDIPRPVPVAEPSPAIAFAVPETGPVQMVDARHAVLSAAPAHQAQSRPVVQTLTFGEGAGRQPAPEYPMRAQAQGEQGDVTIRFTVGEDGQVVAAEVASPSPWSLLNDSALRAVRERWRFSAGSVRVYDIVIHFTLN